MSYTCPKSRPVSEKPSPRRVSQPHPRLPDEPWPPQNRRTGAEGPEPGDIGDQRTEAFAHDLRDRILHHPRHHGKHSLLVFAGNHQKSGLLRWCRISSIHSITNINREEPTQTDTPGILSAHLIEEACSSAPIRSFYVKNRPRCKWCTCKAEGPSAACHCCLAFSISCAGMWPPPSLLMLELVRCLTFCSPPCKNQAL